MDGRTLKGLLVVLAASLLWGTAAKGGAAVVRTFTAVPGGTGTAVYPQRSYVLAVVLNAPPGSTLENPQVADEEGTIDWDYFPRLSTPTKAVFGGTTLPANRNDAWTVAALQVDVVAVVPGPGVPVTPTFTVNAYEGAVDIPPCQFRARSRVSYLSIRWWVVEGTLGPEGGNLTGAIPAVAGFHAGWTGPIAPATDPWTQPTVVMPCFFNAVGQRLTLTVSYATATPAGTVTDTATTPIKMLGAAH